MDVDLVMRFGLALAIGFFIGLQREYAHGAQEGQILAGERTFALVSLSGAVGAMLSDELGASWVLQIMILITGLLAVVGYFNDAWKRSMVGITTEVAVMLAMLIGALCYYDHLILAAALGIITTVILSIKIQTDRFIRALTRKEIAAALQLAVISAIVLPLLPNDTFWGPPFDTLNPFKIWLMVVFISAFNFLGYILVKVVGSQQVIGLAGLLGGLVSSTAITLTFSERSQREEHLAKPFALAIIAAWMVMFGRVLVEVGVVHSPLLKVVWLPIAASGAVALAYGLYLYYSQRVAEKSEIAVSNPLDLSSAIKFGLLYAAVLLISRAAMFYYGNPGLYVSSILSGLADVDAITLSVSELSRTGGLGFDAASRAIVLAAMSNTVAKGGIVLISGAPALRKALWPGLLAILVVGIGVAFLV
jgi:uncharacterized membrane protein (DUF4010 family)